MEGRGNERPRNDTQHERTQQHHTARTDTTQTTAHDTNGHAKMFNNMECIGEWVEMFRNAHGEYLWVFMDVLWYGDIARDGNGDRRDTDGPCGQGFRHAVHAKYTTKQICTQGYRWTRYYRVGKQGMIKALEGPVKTDEGSKGIRRESARQNEHIQNPKSDLQTYTQQQIITLILHIKRSRKTKITQGKCRTPGKQ